MRGSRVQKSKYLKCHCETIRWSVSVGGGEAISNHIKVQRSINMRNASSEIAMLRSRLPKSCTASRCTAGRSLAMGTFYSKTMYLNMPVLDNCRMSASAGFSQFVNLYLWTDGYGAADGVYGCLLLSRQQPVEVRSFARVRTHHVSPATIAARDAQHFRMY